MTTINSADRAADQDPSRAGCWRFGAYVLDCERMALAHQGRRVRLEERTMRVLICLLRHADSIVPRTTLLAEAWPGQVVSEGAVAKAIMKLRIALGVDAEQVLLTIYGVGYRLALPAVHEARPSDGCSLSIGSDLPGRPYWRLRERIAVDDAGESWRAVHAKTGEPRIMHIALSPAQATRLLARIRAHAQLARALPHRRDLLRLLEWNTELVPEHAEFASRSFQPLVEWASSDDRLAAMPDDARSGLALACADAVAAAHAVGVAHGDLGDASLFIEETGDAVPSVCIAGFSVWSDGNPDDSEFRQAAQRDIAALGRWLYRLHVGHVDAVIPAHWHDHVADPLLRQDIEQTRADSAGRIERMADLCARLRDLPTRRRRQADAEQASAMLEKRTRELALARRRRGTAVLSTGVLAAVSTVCLGFYLDARQARDASLRAEASARAVSDFMVNDMLGQAEPFYGAGADMRLADLLDLAEGSVDARFADAPELAADVYYALGRVRMGLGDLDRSERLLHRSLSLAGSAWPAGHPGRIATEFQLGDLLVRRARFEEAETRYRKVLTDSVQRYGETHSRSLWVRAELAWLAHELGDSASARDQLREVIEASDAWRKADPSLRELAEHYLALVEVELGLWKDAETRYTRLRRDVVARRGEAHAAVAQIDRNHGALLVTQQRYDAAVQRLRPALLTMATRVGPEHPESLAIESELGAALLGRGDAEEALVLLRHAAEGRRAQLGISHDRTRHTLSQYARTLAANGEYAEAERIAREVLIESERAFDASHPESALFRYRLAALLVERGDVDAATTQLETALRDTRARYGDGHPRAMEIVQLLAQASRQRARAKRVPEAAANAAPTSPVAAGTDTLRVSIKTPMSGDRPGP